MPEKDDWPEIDEQINPRCVVEGKKAGAVTVAVTWGWHTADNLAAASPDHMVNTLSALENLLS